MESAAADLAVIAKRLEELYPDSNSGQGASVQPLSEAVMGNLRTPFLSLLGGAGLLLLIGGVNVASLLLVRTERRGREIAVRGALGASPARLIRHLVVENLAVTVFGGMLGLVAGVWTIRLLMALFPPDILIRLPFLSGVGLNYRVAAFACALTTIFTLLITSASLSRLPWSNLSRGLAEGSRGSAGTAWRRLGGKLVVVELAVTMMLLTGAGLLGGSLHRLLRVELGFQPDNLATIQVAAPDVSYGDKEKSVALGREITGRIASLPGVQSVGIGSLLPVTFNGNTDWIRFVGRPYDGGHIEVNQRDVSADYFKTLQAKLIRGRYFTDAEDASKPRVAIVNQTFARLHFPNRNPIGQQFGDTALSPGSIKEIVGVVEDIRDGSLDSEIWPTVFYPFNQSPGTYFAVVARVSQSERSFIPTLISSIRGIDSDLGTVDASTMLDRINDSPVAYLHRSFTWLVGGFAAAALLLGVVGLYGVIAYSVGQRTREIGIRIALGAQRGQVFQLIVGEAGRLIVAGVIAGLVISIGTATFLCKLLFETEAWDAPTLIVVTLVLVIASLLASVIPARRAAKIDPMVTLRHE
jgi:predicted permease